MEAYLTLILFGGFLALLILGAPITVSLAGAAMAAYFILDKPLKGVSSLPSDDGTSSIIEWRL